MQVVDGSEMSSVPHLHDTMNPEFESLMLWHQFTWP